MAQDFLQPFGQKTTSEDFRRRLQWTAAVDIPRPAPFIDLKVEVKAVSDPIKDLNDPFIDLKVEVKAMSDPFTDLSDPFMDLNNRDICLQLPILKDSSLVGVGSHRHLPAVDVPPPASVQSFE